MQTATPRSKAYSSASRALAALIGPAYAASIMPLSSITIPPTASQPVPPFQAPQSHSLVQKIFFFSYFSTKILGL